MEIGYGIVSDRRRLGFASEAVRGLLAHAFAVSTVHRVIAHTLPDLTSSMGILHKCGFQPNDERPEPGGLRFAITRSAHGLAPGAD